ncbi:MAG: tyrosine-type recombinase/integrase [Candidatus Lokiarchaeota archaeon]|nr:tyrosine-type recombinase/integrase [Candidatus Lokiarchaeota archaeon]
MVAWKPSNEEEEKIFSLFNQSRKIQCFINRLKSKSTKSSYRTELRKFFIYLNENPDSYILGRKEFRKLQNEQQYDYTDKLEEDIENYIDSLLGSEKPPAPKTLITIKSAIKRLLEKNRIDLGSSFWKELTRKLPKNKAVTEKETPTQKELKSILNQMKLPGKALFMVQMTSFSRLDEILKVKLEDIQLDYEFPRIKIPYTNSKNRTIALKRISPEAKEILLDYLKIRKDYLKNKLIKRGIKNKKELEFQIEHDDRLFPMSIQNANQIWTTATKKTGLYRKDGNRCTMGFHSLRRYAKMNFIKAYKGVDDKTGKYWANVFMNKGTEADKVYDDYTSKDFDKQYSYGVNGLIVFANTLNFDNRFEEMKDKLETANNRIQLQQTRLSSQELKINELTTLVERMVYDQINPFSGPQLNHKQEKIEEEYETKALNEHNKNIIKSFKKEIIFRKNLRTLINDYYENKSNDNIKKISKILYPKLSPSMKRNNDIELVQKELGSILTKYSNLNKETFQNKSIKHISDVFSNNNFDYNNDIELIDIDGKYLISEITEETTKFEEFLKSYDENWDEKKKEEYRNKMGKFIEGSMVSLTLKEEMIANKFKKILYPHM